MNNHEAGTAFAEEVTALAVAPNRLFDLGNAGSGKIQASVFPPSGVLPRRVPGCLRTRCGPVWDHLARFSPRRLVSAEEAIGDLRAAG